MHSEPSDLISGLMTELAPSNARKASTLSQSSRESPSEELLMLRKVQLMVEKVELVVRAWTKERGTGMQSLILGIRKVVEKELRKELMGRKLVGRSKDWGSQDSSYSLVKDFNPSHSADCEGDKFAFNHVKFASRPSSTFKRSFSSISDSSILQLTSTFTESVKHYLVATKHQARSLTPKSAKAKQELTSKLIKLEEQLTGAQTPTIARARFPTPKQVKILAQKHKEEQIAIVNLSEMLMKAETMRWNNVETALNSVYAKVVEVCERLQPLNSKLHRQKTLRQASISSLTELHGEVRSLKQLLATCMHTSPQLHPSALPSPPCLNCFTLQEALHMRNCEFTALQQETEELKSALQGYSEEKWGEMEVETVRLASLLEVATSERDQANALMRELQSEAEIRLGLAVAMVREDYCSNMQRMQDLHYQLIKELNSRIWKLEETVAHQANCPSEPENSVKDQLIQSKCIEQQKNGLGMLKEVTAREQERLSIKPSDYA